MKRVLLALAPVLLAVFVAGYTLTAANTVPDHDAVNSTRTAGPNQKRPPECAGLDLTATLIAPSLTGSAANELIIGSSAAETISGNGGDDCIMGGGGNDVINGGTGTNVLIGGPGTDTCVSGTKYSCEL